MTIRDAIRGALERLKVSGSEEERQYAEVFMRLFGFTPGTRTENAKRRWLAALDYYEENANFDGRAATLGNLQRRIGEEELYPVLVKALIEWEGKLRDEEARSRDPKRERARRKILSAWDEEIWKLCQAFALVENASRDMRHCLEDSNKATAKRARNSSLKAVGMIWRFIREMPESLSPDPEEDQDELKLLHIFLDDFRRAFAFSNADHAWIDDAIDNEVEFMGLGDGDETSRLILARYSVLFDPCNCPRALPTLFKKWSGSSFWSSIDIDYRYGDIDYDSEPFDIVDNLAQDHLLGTYKWSQPDMLNQLCPIHMMLCWHQILNSTLRNRWWEQSVWIAQDPW